MASIKEKKSLKSEFAKWLIDNPKVNYYKNDFYKIIQELDKYNDFFSVDIYDDTNVKEIYSFLQKELYETNSSPFLEFSEKTSRHLPRAVLGNNNYLEFLNNWQNQKDEKSKFTWVPTYKAIVKYLESKENDQVGLIQLLKDSGCDVFNDQNENGNLIELEEIDPFTFFCYLNKYFKQRLGILQKLASSINAPTPSDDYGIPSANPQKVWMFPYKYIRTNNEVGRLWKFFYNAISYNISNEQFKNILLIKGVAKTKITEALFYVNPDNYFPLNGPTKPYLEEVLNISSTFETFDDYKKILDEIKIKSNKPFYQLSYEAWKWNDSQDTDLKEFQKSINKNSTEDLEFYFDHLQDIISHLGLSEGDQRVVFSCKGNYLNFNIGQRITWRLDPRKGRRFHIMTDKIIDEKSEPFDGGPDHFYNVFNNSNEIDIIKKSSLDASKIELMRTTKSGYKKHNNEHFERAVYDKAYREKFFKTELMDNKKNKLDLNQILFGPPGTGKTFNTVNKALEIIDPDFFKQHKTDRAIIKAKYEEYVKSGNIVFTTFHQSMSYEDFIEGIKPVITSTEDSSGLDYEIKDGILKELVSGMTDSSDKSNNTSVIIDGEKFDLPINKISLGNINEPEDDEIFHYCIENNCIALGFGEDIDFSEVNDRKDIRDMYRSNGIEFNTSMAFEISAIERLVLWMKEGQLVLIPNGNKKLRAIGVISGEYYCDPSTPIRYSQFRKVNWLYTDLDIPIKQIYGKNFSQQTIYVMNKDRFDKSYFSGGAISSNASKNHVLIIDEINRGNVSSIFGELITLLEENKRKGNPEQLEVVLPYSKEVFSIPNNLYIIGTMNTADRSVEALDTALRRRFSFTEMLPKADLLRDNKIEGINLETLLNTINSRIEILLDTDHTIGHSYFMTVKTLDDLKLVFKDKVIPLLQEYFYGDFGKIGLVLGSGFVRPKQKQRDPFADFDYDDKDGLNRDFYELINMNEKGFDFKQSINSLFNNESEA